MDLVVRQQTLLLSRRRWPSVSTCDHSFCYLGWASSRFLVQDVLTGFGSSGSSPLAEPNKRRYHH